MATITFGKSGTRPYCTLQVTQESQSAANNTSTVKYVLTLVRPSSVSSSATKSWSVTINGTKKTGSGSIGGSGNKTLLSGTMTIPHNSDGTKTISFSGSCQLDITWSGTQLGTISGSGSMTLTKIPRYATVSQALSSKTETTAAIKWTSDSVIDYIWFSTNNGSSWSGINVTDGTSGTYTISGLSDNTTYQIKTRVRNKASQLTTDSSALSVTTYQFPYATSMPDFTIGGRVTIGIYNPLGRTVTINLIGADGSTLATDTLSGTSIAGFNNSTVQGRMYASIPNAKSGTYQVKITYGSSIITKTGGKYTIDEAVCKPSISSVAYKDTNSSIVAITGNNQKIVQNKSTVQYSALGLTAKNSASIASCKVSVNGNTYNLTVSGSTASGGNAAVDSGTDIQATFTLTDSRGLTATKQITLTMLALSNPTAVISLERESNFYTSTTLLVNAEYSSVDGQNTISIAYACTRDGQSSASVSGTVTNGVASTLQLDNNYAWKVVVTLTDRFNNKTIYTLALSRGTPIIFFDRLLSSVGVNCFPQEENSFEVGGHDLNYETAQCQIASGWETYGNTEPPTVRRQGRVVQFVWACNPTADILLNTTQQTVCTIPVGFRPSTNFYCLCQGSGTSFYQLGISTNGNVMVSRLRDIDGTGFETATSSMWFPLSATWVM